MLEIEDPPNCSCYVRCKVKLEEVSRISMKYILLHVATRCLDAHKISMNLFFYVIGLLTKHKMGRMIRKLFPSINMFHI